MQGGAFAPALASPTALVNPLGAALANPWPYGLKSAAAGPGDPFRVLTTCSWEQSDTMVKVYVPLRGVQTDMLRPTFTSNSVEVPAPLRLSPFCKLKGFISLAHAVSESFGGQGSPVQA